MKWFFEIKGVRAVIAAIGCAALLGAYAGVSRAVPANTISFSSVNAPETDAEKRAILVSDKAVINGQPHVIGYHTVLRSGDAPGGGTAAQSSTAKAGIFGLAYDKFGNPIKALDGSLWISNSNDFASLLIGTDKKLYMVSHFEDSPGSMYVTELDQDAKSGNLTAVRTRNIDFSHFGGGWVHCAGSVTPWGTHLGSEEYEPDARKVDPVTGAWPFYDMNQALYYGLNPKDTKPGAFDAMNVYDYGWQIEVKADNYDTVTAAKHYAMGRLAHELAYVMPDNKTAYISDDGANVGLFRFVADNPKDLSSGELFIAKWNQTGTDNGGSADITWISLGRATDAEIQAYLKQKIKFADIFDSVAPNADATCPDGFTSINTTPGHECLKVKPGMEKAASRLETRRYGAMKGGTTEFNKMEGITFDPARKVLYIAMSDVDKGMKDNDAADKGGPNHIRVPVNRCGTVYGLDLDANYTATKMYGVVAGIPLVKGWGGPEDKPYPADGPYAKNKCDLNGIANPDNLTFITGYRTLIIGEDTGDGHQNDIVWAYSEDTKGLTRIQTTPYGSETTSPYFYPNINGWGYLMSVVQHPYGESDQDQAAPGSEARRAYTGYIGPFPAMN